jgi:Domain of Unknown Function (DUF1080)
MYTAENLNFQGEYNMKKDLIFGIAAVMIASLACSFGGIGSGTGSGPDSNVLFQDDFSNSLSGWDSVTDDDRITNYKDGSYQIQVNTIGTGGSGMDMWANPGLSFDGDVRVEVDATKNDGPDDNDMGVICRYTDNDDSFHFYFFLISSDGYVGISKMDNTSSHLISGEEMLQSDTIKTGETNHIRADCIGSKLTLYVNGQQAATATDTSYTTGDVGLIAGTFDTPGTDVLFDNFKVTKP